MRSVVHTISKYPNCWLSFSGDLKMKLKMNSKRKFALIPIAAALMGFGPVAHADWTASFNDLVNDVSGTLSYTGFSGGAQHYTLILDTSDYSGGAAYLDSVNIKAFSDYSSFTYTASAGSYMDPAGTAGINNGPGATDTGCDGPAGGGFACLEAMPKGQAPLQLALDSIYTFTFDVFGATDVNTTGFEAKVGVGFADATGMGPYAITAQLTSPVTTPIPEPETYAMLLAGLGLMGFVARRRQRKLAFA